MPDPLLHKCEHMSISPILLNCYKNRILLPHSLHSWTFSVASYYYLVLWSMVLSRSFYCCGHAEPHFRARMHPCSSYPFRAWVLHIGYIFNVQASYFGALIKVCSISNFTKNKNKQTKFPLKSIPTVLHSALQPSKQTEDS